MFSELEPAKILSVVIRFEISQFGCVTAHAGWKVKL